LFWSSFQRVQRNGRFPWSQKAKHKQLNSLSLAVLRNWWTSSESKWMKGEIMCECLSRACNRVPIPSPSDRVQYHTLFHSARCYKSAPATWSSDFCAFKKWSSSIGPPPHLTWARIEAVEVRCCQRYIYDHSLRAAIKQNSYGCIIILSGRGRVQPKWRGVYLTFCIWSRLDRWLFLNQIINQMGRLAG
jgi:hypothetical protein